MECKPCQPFYFLANSVFFKKNKNLKKKTDVVLGELNSLNFHSHPHACHWLDFTKVFSLLVIACLEWIN